MPRKLHNSLVAAGVVHCVADTLNGSGQSPVFENAKPINVEC